MWRGYIVGLSKGTVPNDLDLMVGQIDEIRSSINAFLQRETLTGQGGETSSIGGGSRHQGLQKRTSVTRSEDSGVDTMSRRPQSIGTRHSSSSGSRDTISGGGGGPTMRHKFSNNPNMDDEAPRWFFHNCSRDLAEKILVNNAGRFGNTLMRESSSQKSSGSYVISKIGKVDGKVKVEHFEVERIDRGYRIKVENDHEPQKNLTGVMNTFRFIAGYDNTIPIKTNDLLELGLSEEDKNPYITTKIRRELSNCRELPEPLPDYEEPVPRPSKTFTPGILKKEQAKYERRRSPSPTEFDPPAPHRETLYINTHESGTAASALQKPRPPTPTESSPPPPEPHTPDSQAYYNEKEFKDLKGKEPQHKRSKSVPNIWNQMSLHSQGEDLNTPVHRNISPPKSVIPTAPPPPSVASPPPCATSPTQRAPGSILKSTNRGLPSLPPLPQTPSEEPRSSVETSALNAAALGLRPVAKRQENQKNSSSSSLPSNHVPSPQQLGLRHVDLENTKTRDEQTTKDYEDHESFQDKLKKFQRKAPPSTAPKPSGKPRVPEEETYDDAISMGVGRKPSFIRKLEEQIGRPVPGPPGAAMVPEIKPMTEEEEQEYHEIK